MWGHCKWCVAVSLPSAQLHLAFWFFFLWPQLSFAFLTRDSSTDSFSISWPKWVNSYFYDTVVWLAEQRRLFLWGWRGVCCFFFFFQISRAQHLVILKEELIFMWRHLYVNVLMSSDACRPAWQSCASEWPRSPDVFQLSPCTTINKHIGVYTWIHRDI